MTWADVETLEDAADTLIRLHAVQTAVRLYALALRIRAELQT
jgi:hypothetical protein